MSNIAYTPLEEAREAALECAAVAHSLFSTAKGKASLSDLDIQCLTMLVRFLGTVREKTDAIQAVSDDLTAAADARNDLPPFGNWHCTAANYAARCFRAVTCPNGRPSKVIGKKRSGEIVVDGDALRDKWTEISKAVLGEGEIDFERMTLLIKRESRQAAKPAAAATADQSSDVFVPASRLWKNHFETYKKFRRFLELHPEIPTRNPRENRLEVHAAKFLDIVAKSRDNDPTAALDDENVQELIADVEARKAQESANKRRK